GIENADSGLCARLTFGAASPQKRPSERRRSSPAKNNQPAAPAPAAAFLFSRVRKTVASSRANFCCGSESEMGAGFSATRRVPNEQSKRNAQKIFIQD